MGLNNDKMCYEADNFGFGKDDDGVEDEGGGSLTVNSWSFSIISSTSSVVGIGVGGVSRVDHLYGRRSLITVDFREALDSPSATSGLGVLGALVVLCIP
ncbi:hypothetical protein Tco_1494194 [Tanacetum coccineum]